jgi:hypothetical protein
MTCMAHMLVRSFMHHAHPCTVHALDSCVLPCSVSLLIVCQQSRPRCHGVQASFGEAQRFLTAQGINPPVLADKAGKAGSAAEGVFNQAKPSLTSSLTSLTSRDPTTLAEYALGAVAFYYLVSVSRLLWFCPAYSCLNSHLSGLLKWCAICAAAPYLHKPAFTSGCSLSPMSLTCCLLSVLPDTHPYGQGSD